MACKDKTADTQILRSISEKNVKKSIEVPYNLIDISWEGNFLDIQIYIQNLEDVLYVTKMSDKNYIATVISREM